MQVFHTVVQTVPSHCLISALCIFCHPLPPTKVKLALRTAHHYNSTIFTKKLQMLRLGTTLTWWSPTSNEPFMRATWCNITVSVIIIIHHCNDDDVMQTCYRCCVQIALRASQKPVFSILVLLPVAFSWIRGYFWIWILFKLPLCIFFMFEMIGKTNQVADMGPVEFSLSF